MENGHGLNVINPDAMDTVDVDVKGLDDVLLKALTAVASPSKRLPAETPKVESYDFDEGINYEKMFSKYATLGFQAAHLGNAIKVINAMIDCKLQPMPTTDLPTPNTDVTEGRRRTNCTIFMGYTSNMVSCGTRDMIRYLAKHNMIDCIVNTAGGIEEDIMKCMKPFYMGKFTLKGSDLHKDGICRTGNLLVPSVVYRQLHSWLNPILEEMLKEQRNGYEWTPCRFIWRLGKEINNPESIYYWAYVNKIPVLSPAITDGGIGDILFFHAHKHPEGALKLDIVQDTKRLTDMVLNSINTGVFICGAGLVKHHILNANSFRNGAEFAVYVNTAAEFDGSDAGATPDEAVSWGKISVIPKLPPVKVYTDASLVLPIIIGESFAKRQAEYETFYANQAK